VIRARALLAIFVFSVTISATSAVSVKALDCAPWDYVCQSLASAQANQAAAQAKLGQIQNQIQDVQVKSASIVQLLRQLDTQIKQQQSAIQGTQRRIDDLDRQIRFIVADIQLREAHLIVRQDLFDQRVRSMDKHGTINYFELVVTSTSFNQLVDRLLVMQEVVRADRKMLDELQQQRADVDKEKADLAQKRTDEQTLLQQQQAQEAQLQATKVTQQQALEYYNELAAELQQYAAEEAAQLAQINDEVSILQQEYQDELNGLTGGGGKFLWPEAPPRAYISQGFGCTDFAGEPPPPAGVSCNPPYFHYGIDIAGPYGTPVLAADTGIVQNYPGSYGYGNYVIVLHPGGYYTLYGHLAGFTQPDGKVVGMGTQIGIEGSTGFSTGPHLHFGIWYNDYPVNPCAYIIGGC
jgi:murein DD-endopeptidase MepM/ murein hydrolase activator NlpD